MQLEKLIDRAALNRHEELDLSGRKLKEIPSNIENCTNLKSPDISDNRLVSIPQETGNLSNLQHLDISDNRLTTLPSTIGKLTSLENLRLGCNDLRKEITLVDIKLDKSKINLNALKRKAGRLLMMYSGYKTRWLGICLEDVNHYL